MFRKLAYVLVCQVTLGLAIGACSSAESSQPEPSRGPSPAPEATTVERKASVEGTDPSSDLVSQLIRKALQSDGSVSYRTLVNQLGTPRRVEKRPIANQYVRGQIDTLRTLFYQGIEALVYDVTSEEKALLLRFSLSSPKYATPEGVRVGLSKQRAVEKIGPPTRRDASQAELIYQETESTPTSLVVHVREGQVVGIDWEFYVA